MAEKRHVQHVRSKVVEQNGQPKLPSASDLLYGELAINYHKGTETVSLKNDQGEIVTIHPDEIQIGTSASTILDNTKVFIDTEMDSTVEVYTKDQVDSQMSGVTNDITSIKTTNQTQDSRIQALEGKDAAHDTRLNEIDEIDTAQNGRLDTLEEAVRDNIVISDTTPTSSNTELFVDTSNDGPLYEVYTKSQVDAIVANLQTQIDELKNH